MEHSPHLSPERPCDEESLNVTSTEEPSPELSKPSDDEPPTAVNNTEDAQVRNVEPSMDEQMDVSTPCTTPTEPATEQMDESFPSLVTSSEEPAPKYSQTRSNKSSSSDTTSSSDSDSSSTSDDSSSEDSETSVSPSPEVPITEAQATESANKNDHDVVASAEGNQTVGEPAAGEGLADALTTLVEEASLRPPSPIAGPSRENVPRITYSRKEEPSPQRRKTSLEKFTKHPWAHLLRGKTPPVVTDDYDSDLRYSGLVYGLFPAQCDPATKGRKATSILAAVGPKAIEAFRENNDCSQLLEKRRQGQPLPKMPIVESARSIEESNAYVKGLVLDGNTAPVLYRVKNFFGKSGLTLTKLIIGDLIWVYKLSVTVTFEKSDMPLPQTIVRASCFRLAAARDAPSIKENSFIVAPFRERQFDYMVFACAWNTTSKELASHMVDVPYFPSQAPAPYDIRLTSKEHQNLVHAKLHDFKLFRDRPEQMEEEYLDVTARLETSDGVRLRAYLISSRNGRIAVGTVLHTLDERANPVLALLEHSCMPHMNINSVGWLAARVLLSGDVQVTGYDFPDHNAITVTVAGSQIELNADQVNAINMYNKEYPIQIVDSAYGAGKSVCAAIMAEESAKQQQIILVTAVQNSALDVIGAKIADLQSEHIRAVRYVSEILAQDDKDYKRFKRFSEQRQQLREFMFSNTQINVVNKEHKRLLFLEERTSWDLKVLTNEASMVPEATLMTLNITLSGTRALLSSGDSKQLPPYVGVQSVPLAVAVSSRSVLDLVTNPAWTPICHLRTVYRPHIEMMYLNSELFYDGSLSCGSVTSLRQALLSRVTMPNSRIPVALINIPSYSVQSVTGSHSNIVEATAAHVLVRYLLAKGFAPAQIMVICLYRDQKLLCERILQQTDVTVSTVDSAQGKENSVVILCTTRTEMEPNTAASFFSDARRLNVALSRAKDDDGRLEDDRMGGARTRRTTRILPTEPSCDRSDDRDIHSPSVYLFCDLCDFVLLMVLRALCLFIVVLIHEVYCSMLSWNFVVYRRALEACWLIKRGGC
ncbi:hypothetical protein OSTOST_23669 [Ostertagia ostertagi]